MSTNSAIQPTYRLLADLRGMLQATNGSAVKASTALWLAPGYNFIMTNSVPNRTKLVIQGTTSCLTFYLKPLSLSLSPYPGKMWNKSSISSLLFVCKICFLACFLTFLWLQSLLLTHLKMPLTPGYDFIISVQVGLVEFYAFEIDPFIVLLGQVNCIIYGIPIHLAVT